MKVAFLQHGAYEKASVHSLAAALESHGIDCDVFVEALEADFFSAIIAYQPDVLAYSLYIGEEAYARRYFQMLKPALPAAVTVIGGPFTLLFPEIAHEDGIDYVLRGDGEKSFPQLIEQLSSGGDLSSVPGLCFRNKLGEMVQSNPTELIDVAEVSSPNRDLYYKYKALREAPTKIFVASRGCPYSCTFCYSRQLAGFFPTSFWRVRPVAAVIEEISYVRDNYPLKWVHFQDGTFNANRSWLEQLLRAYQAAKLPEFMCNLRADNLDAQLVHLLKQAGCNRVTFGIQSGDPELRQQLTGRHTENEQTKKACQLCREQNIRVGVDIIFGWPGETVEQGLKSIRLCRELNVETYSSNVLIFYPGLQITKYAFENGYIEKLPTLSDIAEIDLNVSSLSRGPIVELSNMDKLFFYFVKFPALEWLLLRLIKLPANRVFVYLKQIPALLRQLRYDRHQSKLAIIWNYLKMAGGE